MMQRAVQRLAAAAAGLGAPATRTAACSSGVGGVLSTPACSTSGASSSRSASSLPGDYSLVMNEQAKELSNHVPTPDSEIGMCAGVPLETFARKVRVVSPARTAGQQGLGNTLANNKGRPWRIAFDLQDKWINPLMGWTSTADPLENVGRSALLFPTKDEALAFCAKHGWEAQVEDPEQRRNVRQKRFAGYGDNFSIKRAGVPDLSTLPSERGVGGGGSAAKPKAAAKKAT